MNVASVGQVIENTAYIYFDFNEPVITNTAMNTYVIPTTIAEEMNSNGLVSIYPNPFNTSTTFVINSDKTDAVYTFELYDVLGKKVNELTNITAKQFHLTRSGLENGMYFYKIYTSEKVIGNGKLIVK
jgi:fructose 1,6-bisphosphatase